MTDLARRCRLGILGIVGWSLVVTMVSLMGWMLFDIFKHLPDKFNGTTLTVAQLAVVVGGMLLGLFLVLGIKEGLENPSA